MSSTASTAPTSSEAQLLSGTPSCPPTSTGQSLSMKREQAAEQDDWTKYFLKYSIILNEVLIQVRSALVFLFEDYFSLLETITVAV